MKELLADLASGISGFQPARFRYGRFLFVLAISLPAALLFVALKTPLPWMLGPMAACTLAALFRLPVAVPSNIRAPMTVVLAVLLGSAFTPEIVQGMGAWLPSVIGLVLCIVVAGFVSVAYLRIVGKFDPATAYFSGMPGGLVEMVVLGEQRGADVPTIALAHSARLLLTVFSVPFIVSLVTGVSIGRSSTLRPSFIGMEFVDFGWMTLTAILGVIAGYVFKLPARIFMGPMAVGAFIHAAGWSTAQPPAELLNIAQLIIGSAVGCRFAGGSVPRVLQIFALSAGSTTILLLVTAFFAFALNQLGNFGFAPVFLAYAPGGLAEMCLIALALHIEVAFVAAHHLVRVVLVLGGAGLAFNFFKRF